MDKTNSINEQVNLEILVDQETLEAAEQICEELGIPLSVAVIVLLKQIAIQRAIPFPITLHPTFRQSGV